MMDILYVLAFIVIGWMLHKNHHEILSGLRDLYWWLEEQSKKMPDIKSHRGQYWTAWLVASILSITLSVVWIGFTLLSVACTSLVWIITFPTLYVTLTKVWR